MIDGLRRSAAIAADHGLRAGRPPARGQLHRVRGRGARGCWTSPISTSASTPGTPPTPGPRPSASIAEYGPRLGHLHLKDVRADVLARVRDEGLDFWAAIAAGSSARWARASSTSRPCSPRWPSAGYRGYATIEQDRVPGSGSPLDDLAESRRVLASAGLAEAAR